jgi:hypothetical protein
MTFPLASFGTWRNGDEVNKLEIAGAGDLEVPANRGIADGRAIPE